MFSWLFWGHLNAWRSRYLSWENFICVQVTYCSARGSVWLFFTTKWGRLDFPHDRHGCQGSTSSACWTLLFVLQAITVLLPTMLGWLASEQYLNDSGGQRSFKRNKKQHSVSQAANLSIPICIKFCPSVLVLTNLIKVMLYLDLNFCYVFWRALCQQGTVSQCSVGHYYIDFKDSKHTRRKLNWGVPKIIVTW